ncbi:tumor necrosis factor receptor superfamily member 14 isoform X1 [Mustela lutreola]|uniref:tumor necrosis factor receptor superfamily member 14 isoform X1 n=2 Tax=Mustela lutreola TaxID=9666 RepID=UPI00279755FC|nr:tumor necrosis factor receptor superfamily member 14 isoform X1 [Mustela lutreola]
MAACKEEEYPVGSECCPKCSPAMGLVTRQKCSQTENTVCVCDQGYFCVSEDGDDCAECSPHTPCRPGQRVRARGTERQDRVCEDCPPGTFSPSGTLEECQPWSMCDGPLQTQAEPGTSSSDVTCSSPLPAVVGSVCVATAVFCLLVLGIRMRRRRTPEGPSLKEDHTGRSQELRSLQPHRCETTETDPDVTVSLFFRGTHEGGTISPGPEGPTRRHHSGYGGDNICVPWDGMTHLRMDGSWRQTPKPS